MEECQTIICRKGDWMEGKVIQYARRDAVQYARRWALSRNRAYNDFTKGGGDCMNFVSQCLYAGGLPFKNNGFEWHGLRGGSSFSWRGVDSFLKQLKNYQQFGSPRLEFSCEETPESLKAGDLVFTVAEGVPGDIERNPSHVVILSHDYADRGQLVVCGHTVDQLDAVKRRDDTRCTYIHIEQIAFDFAAEDYADERDRVTAAYELGEHIEKTCGERFACETTAKRLAYLGYDAGVNLTAYLAHKRKRQCRFQKISGAQFGLKSGWDCRRSNQRSIDLSTEMVAIRDSGRRAAVF